MCSRKVVKWVARGNEKSVEKLRGRKTAEGLVREGGRKERQRESDKEMAREMGGRDRYRDGG